MYKVLLCLRYLRTRYIALASIISVTLGVATMIVVNSVMAGFSTEMRDRIHGILADVLIESNSLNGVADADKHMALARQAAGEHIAGMTATVEIYGMLSFEWQGQSQTRPCTLVGMHPEGKAQVGPLIDYLDSYNPVYEGKKIIRPALRSRDEPPSWNLTEEAKAHRHKMNQQRQWFRDQLRDDQLPSDPNFNPLADNEAHDGDDTNVATAPQQTVARPTTPSSTEPDSSNPFLTGGPGNDLAEETTSTIDPDAPLTGRVIIGLGLIGFPDEDPTTGQVHIVKMAQPGDNVKISTVTAGRAPGPAHFNATIVDTFKSGMSEYDSSLVFCNLETLQKARGMIAPDGQRRITSIQIKLKDFKDAETAVDKLKAVFPAARTRCALGNRSRDRCWPPSKLNRPS
nr:lipoprotein releasing system transmembrane protein LolC [uncultured bacterium]